MGSFSFNTTPGIRFGNQSVSNNIEEIKKCLGERILFITDKGIINLGLGESTISKLRKLSELVVIFDEVEADPSLNILEKAINFGKRNRCTGVIGFGGGSSMDVAKLTALILGSGEELDSAWGVGVAHGPRLPLVLVPTTAGTGSEVTPVSIITVAENEKRGISSPIILPDLAILDPLLTKDLPKKITAATGVDAMVHAIEAFSSKNINNNLMSRMYAIQALKLLVSSIDEAVFHGDNENARANMLQGSMFAGIAFANSPVAAVHALAYPIGGIFHIPHGLSNALILPYVLRFNQIDKSAANAYAELCDYIWPSKDQKKDVQYKSSLFIENLEKLSERVGLETRLRDVGIPRASCEHMAKESMKQTRLLVNNPRIITERDSLEIYLAAW